uniref:Peroxisomal membrane protein PEX14 n=2 Tax=Rhizophora mucronata TaxID=61149 RepID=A0A2P2K1E9_RHIMU
MATQSSSPPSSADDKPQDPAAEVAQAQPTNEIQQDAKAGAGKQSHLSVFVNSEPMREDQIQNAVKFLSHPRVKGSPVIHRRSFLERKGLTKEEIDEAFRRVPDPPPSAQAAAANQEGHVKSTSNIQPAAATQTLQPTVAPPPGASSAGTLPRVRFHWYHGVIAVGILAASGAGTAVLIKNAIVPRLKSWIRKVVLEEEDDHVKKSNAKPSLAEEAAVAAKAAAAAASDVAKASQEMLTSKSQEKACFEELKNLLDLQVQEMKSMSTTISNLAGTNNNNLGRIVYDGQEDHRTSGANAKQTYANGKAEVDLGSVRSSSPPASAEPSVAPHPKSYMEIMAMVQRGEKPSNIRDINDQPPNPNQQILNPRIAPRAKPWEVGQAQYSSSQVVRPQTDGEGLNYKAQDNGATYQADSENIVPWWQRKSPRITEIDNEDEFKTEPYTAKTNGQPVQRTWVPPQPPPVAMPEAAEAIRRPKSSVRKEQEGDDQTGSRPTEVADELQRITKVSESGGVVEINSDRSGLISSEIEEL